MMKLTLCQSLALEQEAAIQEVRDRQRLLEAADRCGLRVASSYTVPGPGCELTVSCGDPVKFADFLSAVGDGLHVIPTVEVPGSDLDDWKMSKFAPHFLFTEM